MVGYCEVKAGTVTSVGVGLVLRCDLVGSDVKGIAGGKCDVLVLGSVVDVVLTYELQGSVTLVSLEHSYDSLRQRNAQTVGLFVLELQLIGSFDVAL